MNGDQVTVTDLKAAIDRVSQRRKSSVGSGHALAEAERDAWKTAYMWRIGFTERWRKEDVVIRERDRDRWISEEKYGTDLIREFLR